MHYLENIIGVREELKENNWCVIISDSRKAHFSKEITDFSNIFRKNGWKRRKSQLRDPMSDTVDKDQKIEKFKNDLKELIKENHLKRKNVHIMDETGIYSNSIAPYTWTFGEVTQAYMCTTGTKRRDTLVATISANGDGFATFIKH